MHITLTSQLIGLGGETACTIKGSDLHTISKSGLVHTLNSYASMGELHLGLGKYFVEYNGDRPHQALGNKTPDEVYQSASGGGAMIVDKYGAKEGLPVALRSSGTALRKDIRNRIQKPGQRRAVA
jgi:hypothetical protein